MKDRKDPTPLEEPDGVFRSDEADVNDMEDSSLSDQDEASPPSSYDGSPDTRRNSTDGNRKRQSRDQSSNNPLRRSFPSSRRRTSSGSPTLRLSGSGSPSNIASAIRRAFSIEDEYMPAQSDDNDLPNGRNGNGAFRDDDFDMSDGSDHIRSPIDMYHQQERSRLRTIAIVVTVLLIVAAVAVSVTSRRKAAADENAVDADVDETKLYCEDPIQSLRDSATIEGIENGAVAADHPLCSQMGVQILREKNGNAIDAAVTVALCLGVANPGSSGMGGGAFILVHTDPVNETSASEGDVDFHDARDGEPLISEHGKITEVIDCREVAPSAATTNMYLNAPNSASIFGGLAIGVPGELRGLELAHARHGRLKWRDVVDPVMRLATRGVEINGNLAHEIHLMSIAYNDSSPDYGLRNLLTRGDSWKKPLREGELLQNQKLGELLLAIMEQGAGVLYSGKKAEDLANDIQEAGGIVTKEDIESYRATLRSPVVARDINGYTIVGVPPPSSGGSAIIGAARFLSGFPTPWASFADTLSAHRFTEACKHVFAIRMSLSDPGYNTDTVTSAVNDLIKGDYMEKLRQASQDNTTLPLSQYGGSKWAQLNDTDGGGNASDAQEGDRERNLLRHFGYLNDGGTSHFSIIDKDGNAVSMTSSINTYFGSKVVSRSAGIVLSNTMDDFSNPGRPNYFGLKPSEANYILPGKKPLSSMSPTLVFRNSEGEGDALGKVILAIGASGGPKIITAVLQVVLYKLIQGISLFESVIYPRLHDQLVYHGSAVTTTENSVPGNAPDATIVVSQRTKDALKRRGHMLADIDYAGTVQAIYVDPETGGLTAVCDVRKGGVPAGY